MKNAKNTIEQETARIAEMKRRNCEKLETVIENFLELLKSNVVSLGVVGLERRKHYYSNAYGGQYTNYIASVNDDEEGLAREKKEGFSVGLSLPNEKVILSETYERYNSYDVMAWDYDAALNWLKKAIEKLNQYNTSREQKETEIEKFLEKMLKN